jgi:SAM-dependent methyltransferase
MSQAPNPEQTEFWNAAPGENWVRHQADLDAIHRGVSETLQSLAAPATGERVLDIGCGAGTTTFDLARAVHPGEVLGIDISAPLLRRAAERRRELQLANAHFLLADARIVPSPVTRYLKLVSCSAPTGPRACSLPVAMPISAPMPNSPPSANWVEALRIRIAESSRSKNRSAVLQSFSVRIASVCCDLP